MRDAVTSAPAESGGFEGRARGNGSRGRRGFGPGRAWKATSCFPICGAITAYVPAAFTSASCAAVG